MSKTKIIARTAVIVAIAIVFQNLRYVIGTLPYSTIIIGSLVNLCIIVAAGTIGIIPAIVVSVVTPIVALFQGHLPHIMLAPVTMAGNAVLAVCFYIFKKSRLKESIASVAGVIVGAVIKWIVMYWVGIKIVLNLFVQNLPEKKVQAISASFSFPQIITAIIGGMLGIIIIKALSREKSVD